MLAKVAFSFSLFLVTSFTVLGQTLITGTILDQKTGKPIENASVYYNETQIGTTTDSLGFFSLKKDARFPELIISCVGYHKIKLAEIPKQRLKILMEPIENTLHEVVITKGNDWGKWGKLFTKLLMSDHLQDYYSAKYKDEVILNPKVISFNYSRETSTLVAKSDEPIYVINDNLGYLIKVDLEEFSYNIKTEFLNYKSTLFFEPTVSSQSLKQIQLATNTVYNGSATHFFSALMSNQLQKEGFQIYRYSEVKDMEKIRVLTQIELLKNKHLKQKQFAMDLYLNDFIKDRDTLKHYQEKLTHKDYVSRKIMPIHLDSIWSYNENEKTYKLRFRDSLLVTYTPEMKKSPSRAKFTNMKLNAPKEGTLETIIYQTNLEPVVMKEGTEAQNYNLFMVGYMAWKRLAASLPNDFDPSVPRIKVNDDALKKWLTPQGEHP